jgi:hypothetical protein
MRRRFRQPPLGLRSDAAIRSSNEIVAAKGPTPGRNRLRQKWTAMPFPRQENLLPAFFAGTRNPYAGHARSCGNMIRRARRNAGRKSGRQDERRNPVRPQLRGKTRRRRRGRAGRAANSLRQPKPLTPSRAPIPISSAKARSPSSIQGPADPQHIEAILAAVRNETVAQILVIAYPPRPFACRRRDQASDRREYFCRRAASPGASAASRRNPSPRLRRRRGLHAGLPARRRRDESKAKATR